MAIAVESCWTNCVRLNVVILHPWDFRKVRDVPPSLAGVPTKSFLGKDGVPLRLFGLGSEFAQYEVE